MILPGFVKDCLHKIRLGIGIAIPIMLEGLPQGEFQRLVSLGVIGVGAQIVPEDDLLPLTQMSQVQMKDILRKAYLGLALVVAAAAVTSGHAPVARPDKCFIRTGQIRARGRLHQDVHDGLGPDAGDGRAADMVDACCKFFLKHAAQERFLLSVPVIPAGVRRRQDNRKELPQLLQRHFRELF